ncbi:hypothetical protein EG68_00099 [Paragonimus skrjabini miyazakii]|uniref:Uncharacterized protein n=1 Tax=Paragonimus skrjabini miyazakii TaxID=59628 RepID=A0A8S9ZAX5_9TREM|nr:hypothetical protein EG68_00099 [Paragonimus skrjabini miyazakii]
MIRSWPITRIVSPGWSIAVYTVVCHILVNLTGVASLTLKNQDRDTGSPLRISFSPPANQARLGAALTVRCEVSPNSDIDSRMSMFLHCPIAPWGAFCFQNCKSACVSEAPGQCPYEKLLGGVTCRTVITQGGQVTYEYTIAKLTTEWLGISPTGERSEWGFFCKSAGSRTPQIWLSQTAKNDIEKEIPAKTTTTFSTTTTTKAPARPPLPPNPNLLVDDAPTDMDKEAKIIITPNELNERTNAVLRELLVVGAIIVVFLSFAVNVFCCIRCALIRQYTKSKGPARMQHVFCMADEIGNARRGRQALPGDQWTVGSQGNWYQKQLEQQHLAHGFREGSFISDSRLLVGPNAHLANTPAFFAIPPELLHGAPLQGATFSDTNSNTTASVDVHTRSGKEDSSVAAPVINGSAFSLSQGAKHPNTERRSKTSSLVLVPGPMGYQLVSAQTSQNPLTAAVASYCLQQQQNLNELQQQLNAQEYVLSANLSSDGVPSCVGSVGNPDSTGLEPYQPSSSEISTLRQNGAHGDPLASMNVLVTTSTPSNGRSTVVRSTNGLASTNLSQMSVSSQPQSQTPSTPVRRLSTSNSNSHMENSPNASQSDSGLGSGSGQLSSFTQQNRNRDDVPLLLHGSQTSDGGPRTLKRLINGMTESTGPGSNVHGDSGYQNRC